MMDMVMNQKSDDDDDDDNTVFSSNSISSSSKGELVRNGTLQLLVLHIHAIRYNFLIQNREEEWTIQSKMK